MLIKTRMTHCSAKFSHNGLKAAVEGGGEEQAVDIRPSRSHVSNLFPIDAPASDVTMYEAFPLAFFPSHSSIYTPRRGRLRQAQFPTIYHFIPGVGTALSMAFPPALSAFAYAVLGTRDELWRWLYSTTGKIRQGSPFVFTSFIFGFYILRFLPPPFTSFLFSLPFLVIFLCIMLGVSVCRFNIYQAWLQESQ